VLNNNSVGQWNALRVLARGRRATVDVNGVRVVDTDLDRFKDQAAKRPGLTERAGAIGLQSGQKRVEFRDIVVRRAAAED
jgi:hypothetical protein